MFQPVLGVSLCSLLNETLDTFVPVLAKSEICTFEVNPGDFIRDYDHQDMRTFREMLTDTGKKAISFHMPFRWMDDISCPDAAIRERALSRFRALMEEASFLGSEILVVHPSTEPIDQTKRAEHIACLRESLMRLEPELRRSEMRIALEFLPRKCMGNKLSDFRAMLKDLPEDLYGVCLDVNHLMGQYAEIPAIVRSLDKQLFTLHLSDYDGIDERHWIPRPGIGVVDWKAFLSALDSIDYAGPFNFETLRNDEITLENRCEEFEKCFRRMCRMHKENCF